DLRVVELSPDGGGQSTEVGEHWHALDFELGLTCVLFKSCSDRIDAGVDKPKLVVLVVGEARPISDGTDGGARRQKLALCGDLRLLHPQVGPAQRPVEGRDVVVAGETRDRKAGIAAVE